MREAMVAVAVTISTVVCRENRLMAECRSTGDPARELEAWRSRDAQMTRILPHVSEVCM
jgi:hypothetical protein